jgi:hypothetical protein
MIDEDIDDHPSPGAGRPSVSAAIWFFGVREPVLTRP